MKKAEFITKVTEHLDTTGDIVQLKFQISLQHISDDADMAQYRSDVERAVDELCGESVQIATTPDARVTIERHRDELMARIAELLG